jgi:hypothetical protein
MRMIATQTKTGGCYVDSFVEDEESDIDNEIV